ncbi:MAG TPA: hypothetical protein ACQGQF_04475 [Xylella fastidiosa subsp. pauca]
MSIFRTLVFFVIVFISRFSFACEIGEPHWDPNQCLDRGEAYAIASASYQLRRSNELKNSSIPGLQVVDCPMTDNGHVIGFGGYSTAPGQPSSESCDSSLVYFQRVYPEGKTCLTRSPKSLLGLTLPSGVRVPSTACYDGCSYDLDRSHGIIGVGQDDGKVRYVLPGMTPNGNLCSVSPSGGSSSESSQEPPPVQDVVKDECTRMGTLTQCVRQDGKYCATSSTGHQYCWKPGEVGTQIASDGNHAATLNKIDVPVIAPVDAPKDKGDWRVDGKGTSTQIINNTYNNYNTTTFASTGSSSGSGGGSSSGSGGSKDGGSGGSGGDKSGGDKDTPGSGSPSGTGVLYKRNGKTLDAVVSGYQAKVNDLPFISGISSFLTISASGECPVFTLSASAYWPEMTFDYHCSGVFLSFLRSAGYIIFAIASYYAVRIATLR